jgi:hypothetical protein
MKPPHRAVNAPSGPDGERWKTESGYIIHPQLNGVAFQARHKSFRSTIWAKLSDTDPAATK